MTKGRARNRPGRGGQSGGFPPSGGRQGERGGANASADRRGLQAGPGRPPGGFKPPHKPHPGQAHRNEQRNHRSPARETREVGFEENGEVWIWGLHAAGAALANPMRKVSLALLTPGAASRLGLEGPGLPRCAALIEARDLDDRLPPGAVHQGVAVRCRPLEGLAIEDVVVRTHRPLAILDQVTDPQNVGAIFRSAAAFGVQGLVMQTRHAPAPGGALARAAAGAIEQVEDIRVVNISRAIDALRESGWTVIGLDGEASQTLEEALSGEGPFAIVLGAEGEGIRQGVANACTGLARIPIQPGMESLNVSNAAAIAFYEMARRSQGQPTAGGGASMTS